MKKNARFALILAALLSSGKLALAEVKLPPPDENLRKLSPGAGQVSRAWRICAIS